MTYKYIHRPRGRYNGDLKESSVFHLISFDGESSVCNQVIAGRHGYEIVERETQPLRSRTCLTCQLNQR